jgi:2-polyprenyl-6-methoxyphenol hydroxylase-like FAD-dependent oxidoreductase
MSMTEGVQEKGDGQEAGAPAVQGGAVELACDVLIVGGGLAGLALARQLLLASDKRVLLLDRRPLPPTRQKVGEATVQMSGYYYARVLEMEEHLLCKHYMKYNLRFYWKGATGSDNFDRYSQSYIRSLSNIVTYQLDRNVFEAELLRVNLLRENFTLHAPVSDIDIRLSEDGPHAFRFRAGEREFHGSAAWVVDASGRGKLLSKRLGLTEKSPIRHGTTFCWVEGLVDIEKLTGGSARDVRLRRERRELGHVPQFLATNHFCGEGFWFWTIPLHGKTSLGLVYDRERVPRDQIATPEKMIDWVCRTFPMFARDLPHRRIVDQGGYVDFAYDCQKTLSASRWALCGEACRFTDPLYSPGGDLISMYNTLITDAILTEDRDELAAKVPLYEGLARAVYDSYVPSFAVSYDTLGDQECFTLRYVWELSIYFGFFVFPFINDLFTQQGFPQAFLRRFTRLGPTNRNLHAFLNAYYHWKRRQLAPLQSEPVFFDFYSFGQLRAAEACFYKIGVSIEEATRVLDEQFANFEDLARWIVAHVTSVVLADPRPLSDPEFIAGIDLRRLSFDPEAMAARLAACSEAAAGEAAPAPWAWRFTPPSMEAFRKVERVEGAAAAPEAAAPEVATAAAVTVGDGIPAAATTGMAAGGPA